MSECVCVHACVRACVRVCVCVRACVVRARACGCVRMQCVHFARAIGRIIRFYVLHMIVLQCTCLLVLPLRVAITVIIASSIMRRACHMCVLFIPPAFLALAEGQDPLSVSVVRLSRNSYTIHSFIALRH